MLTLVRGLREALGLLGTAVAVGDQSDASHDAHTENWATGEESLWETKTIALLGRDESGLGRIGGGQQRGDCHSGARYQRGDGHGGTRYSARTGGIGGTVGGNELGADAVAGGDQVIAAGLDHSRFCRAG